LDSERRGHARLAGTGILVDHHEHDELRRTQAELRQRVIEIRENHALRRGAARTPRSR